MQYLDMLTRLGAGSAHPGGFTATMEQLRRFPLPPESRVLEVGCGTGRTSCHLAKQGHTVTGLDIRPEMLTKARIRSEKEELQLDFIEGSITALPFDDDTFDIVLAESVTNFADIPSAIKEYHRVLKPGGVLYDREVIISEAIPEDVFMKLTSFFGFGGLLTEEAWTALLGASFSVFQVEDRSSFQEHMAEDQSVHPDLHQIIDQQAIFDVSIWRTSLEHDELILDNRDYISYALFVARK